MKSKMQVTGLMDPYDDGHVTEACGLMGIMDTTGRTHSGKDMITGMANMRCRSNGMGGGFAAYGIYPDFVENHCFHVMYLDGGKGRKEAEDYLRRNFKVVYEDEIRTRYNKNVGTGSPLLMRYFLDVGDHNKDRIPDDDYVVKRVMDMNVNLEDAFVFSSGKDMGVFKGIGYPEDLGDFFRLEDYQAYMWVGHGRFPTNTQAWWGGAHPFSILDWTVVHNGELSSYDINRRQLEMYGYFCTMRTDTEVLAYTTDLLMRRTGLPIEVMADIIAAPLWDRIDQMPEKDRRYHEFLRMTYGPLLMNGPFTIIIGHNGEMIGLGDRLRLRPLTAATKGEMVYVASEEAPIRLIQPDLDKAWIPRGGEPVVGRLTKDGRAKIGLPQEKEVATRCRSR